MKRIFAFGVLFVLTFSVQATTWAPAPHTCPVCNHEDTYQDILSYGSYIYEWPSKYELIYWPVTDSYFVYCCPKCHFSTYMWDFDSIPEHKMEPLKQYLATVKMEKTYRTYSNIPMTVRLGIAENVYQILERDKDFWCQFYRITGYHYEQEKNEAKAKEARLTAMNIAKEMLSDPSNKGQEKEFLLIIAAMCHFTGEKDTALTYLGKAGKSKYRNKELGKKDEEGFDAYLTALINEYKELLNK